MHLIDIKKNPNKIMKAVSYIGYFNSRSPVLLMTQVPAIFEPQSFSTSPPQAKKTPPNPKSAQKQQTNQQPKPTTQTLKYKRISESPFLHT